MLPKFITKDTSFALLQSNWASMIDPLLKNPVNSGVLLQGIKLVVGTNVINHRLGDVPQGWIVCDLDSSTSIYRNAAFNDLTLSLVSSAAVTASIYVF